MDFPPATHTALITTQLNTQGGLSEDPWHSPSASLSSLVLYPVNSGSLAPQSPTSVSSTQVEFWLLPSCAEAWKFFSSQEAGMTGGARGLSSFVFHLLVFISLCFLMSNVLSSIVSFLPSRDDSLFCS